jgi:hypothetical protein
MTPRDDAPDLRLLLTGMDGLTDEQAFAKLELTFRELVIGETRRALKASIGIGGMILACCAIDFLSSLYAGQDSSDTTFLDFAGRFLANYDAEKLRALRNRLVHNYVRAPHAYRFSAGRARAAEHLVGERIVVDLLLDDIERAGQELVRLTTVDATVRERVLRRLKTPGLLNLEPQDV